MGLPDALAPTVDEVRAVAGWLWERGWAERNAGNLSIDVTDAVASASPARGSAISCPIPDPVLVGRWLLVSATGARFRDIARAPRSGLLLIRIADDISGYEVVWPDADGSVRVSSELISHLLIHARLRALGSDRRVVLHTHPTHLIALNQMPRGDDEDWLNLALWSMMPEVRVFVGDGVGLAPYRLPGSRALADATVDALRDHRVVVWDRHGCVAVERDLTEAFDLVDTLDKAARIYLACLAAGSEPRGLGELDLDDLADLARRLGIGP